MSCDSNDDELKLTEEYKYLLSYIRPLIDQLDKSRDAQLCLLWLSKLEQCACWERHYRNKILTELCKQVKSNCLKPPFNESPPNGPLCNIICGDWKAREWMIRCPEMEGSTEEVFSSSSHISFRPTKNMRRRQGSPSTWKPGYFCSSVKNKGIKCSKDLMDHSECFAIQKAYHERTQSDQMVIERYQDIIKSLVSQQLKADISPSKLKKLQSTYEVKIAELLRGLKKTQEENTALKVKLDYFEGEMDKINALKNENEDLRKRIVDLDNVKTTLESKCKKSEEDKLLTVSDLISKLNESEKKLKEREKRCKSLERKYEDGYHNFESEYEAKTSEKNKEHEAELASLEKLLEEKQFEINKLKEQISSQNAHFEQEISSLKQQMKEPPNFGKDDKKKMKNLKSKAKKLEKVKEHMTVLFQSQLQQILAKKDFYIASLEMQLKMNNSESGGSIFTSDFNNSLDQKVSNLEAQYRKLLEDSEQQSIKRRQLDLQKIHSLEKQLLSLGGAVEDKESDLDQKVSSLTTVSDFEDNAKCSKAS